MNLKILRFRVGRVLNSQFVGYKFKSHWMFFCGTFSSLLLHQKFEYEFNFNPQWYVIILKSLTTRKIYFFQNFQFLSPVTICVDPLSFDYIVISLVHGGWTNWGTWSECSVTCSDGSRTRSKSCTDPAPLNGGNDCGGGKLETIICENPLCPGNFQNYISGGSNAGREGRPRVQILLIACSFWGNLAKSYVGAPLEAWRPRLGEILDLPPYMIHECQKVSIVEMFYWKQCHWLTCLSFSWNNIQKSK